MMQNKSSQEHIDQVLESLNGINKAAAPPFLYIRVVARLDRIHTSAWAKITMILSRPVVAFACVCMIILLNLFAVFSQTHTISNNLTEAASADDYAQVNNSYLDLENSKP